MCDNIFKNTEEEKRREEFTRLFALLASNLGKRSFPAKKLVKNYTGK